MAFVLGECRLREILQNRDMKPSAFAKRMKCSRQYVNDLITGRSSMSLTFAINASIVLNCRVTDFYVLVPEKNTRS